jgi:ATP/ADP translocase/HEAT repeat protein
MTSVSSSGVSELIESAFHIRKGEARRVGFTFLLLMFLVSMFIIGRILRDTLFLKRYGVDQLPIMYVAVAIGVSSFALVYGHFADRYRRDRIILVSLMIGSGILTSFWLMIASGLADQNSWLYGVLYVFIDVVGGISIIQFWTYANDIFSSREAKRLFGIIGAGGVISNILCGLVVGALSEVLDTHHLLLLCVLLLVASMSCVRALAKEVHAEIDATNRAAGKSKKYGSGDLRSVFESKHIKLIAGVVGVTVLTTTIIDYQFKVIAEASFDSQADLQAYFGYFTLVTGIVACFIQFFLTKRVLNRYGIVTALLVLPTALMLGATSIAFLSSIISVLAAATFTKGTENVTRYTLNNSTMQLLYVPVPSSQRGRAKAFIDGMIKPFCQGASGLVILGLGYLVTEGDKAEFAAHLGKIDIVLLATWIALVLSLRTEYVRSLANTLKSRRLDFSRETTAVMDETTARVLRDTLRTASESEILHALELLPSTNVKIPEAITPLLFHDSSVVRITALKHLAAYGRLDDLDAIGGKFNDDNDEVQAAAIEAYCAIGANKAIRIARSYLNDDSPMVRAAVVTGLIKYGGLDGILTAAESLKSLLRHKDAKVRLHGARVLTSVSVPNFYQPILELLQDPSYRVRCAALEAAGEMKSPELRPSLIYALSHRQTMMSAREAISRYGPSMEEVLHKVMENEEEDLDIRIQIPPILVQIGSENSFHQLVELLSDCGPSLGISVARSAARLTERLQDISIDDGKILDLTISNLHNSYQALAAACDMKLQEDELLYEALLRQQRVYLGLAFRLLEIRYPSRTVQLIFSNLDSNNKRVRANAIELADNLFGNDECRLLLPLVEDQTVEKKLDIAAGFFELKRLPKIEWLRNLLRHDNDWLVTCALHYIAKENISEITLAEIEKHTFSNDHVVSETALLCLGELLRNGHKPKHDDERQKYVLMAEEALQHDALPVQRAGKSLLSSLESGFQTP